MRLTAMAGQVREQRLRLSAGTREANHFAGLMPQLEAAQEKQRQRGRHGDQLKGGGARTESSPRRAHGRVHDAHLGGRDSQEQRVNVTAMIAVMTVTRSMARRLFPDMHELVVLCVYHSPHEDPTVGPVDDLKVALIARPAWRAPPSSPTRRTCSRARTWSPRRCRSTACMC